MRKFISKLSIISTLIGLAFILHSCSTDGEDPATIGNASFFADNTVGFTQQAITITITDKNDDEVTTHQLRQYATNPNCGLPSAIDVFTAELPEGKYNVYAVEANDGDAQGAWFTGVEGYALTITAGTCQRFKLGDNPFEEQEPPASPAASARLASKGMKLLTITPYECDCENN
ncbi:hypothetical protein [Flammeovirga pacifica]|uniref:Lipoprotein n=1 Tax=Flammeovirga pacifica TaxID=915059 RepID=A0A1S1YYV9_FLAPC|nr:hypothetical protein [Flammeovirga pacifica]OHX66055.1 hypothetical protein NH26_06670 [Flammeovirga pacifica]